MVTELQSAQENRRRLPATPWIQVVARERHKQYMGQLPLALVKPWQRRAPDSRSSGKHTRRMSAQDTSSCAQRISRELQHVIVTNRGKWTRELSRTMGSHCTHTTRDCREGGWVSRLVAIQAPPCCTKPTLAHHISRFTILQPTARNVSTCRICSALPANKPSKAPLDDRQGCKTPGSSGQRVTRPGVELEYLMFESTERGATSRFCRSISSSHSERWGWLLRQTPAFACNLGTN
jgi:hypothetical protein